MAVPLSPPMPRWRTRDEAAKQLGIHRRTLDRWIAHGLIKTYSVLADRRLYVDLDQIAEARKPREHKPKDKDG